MWLVLFIRRQIFISNYENKILRSKIAKILINVKSTNMHIERSCYYIINEEKYVSTGNIFFYYLLSSCKITRNKHDIFGLDLNLFRTPAALELLTGFFNEK